MFTINDAAEYLHIHRITLYRLLRENAVPGAFKVGRVWRIPRAGLEQLMASKAAPPT